jgi:hypothetical protein
MGDARKRFLTLKDTCGRINDLTVKIVPELFFQEIAIEPQFSNAQLCFNTLISYCYILLFEASEKNLPFIRKKLQRYQILSEDDALRILKITHSFRTVLQHNIDIINSISDREKMEFCNVFFYEVIQKEKPESDDDWEKCCINLLDSTISYLDAVYYCLREIQKSENLDIIKEEWREILSRNYSVYNFEVVLVSVLENFGLGGIFDTNKLCKREFDKWKKELGVLKVDFTFEIEAKRIIESFVLRKEILPVTSGDLLEIGFRKGSDLLMAMEKARKIFYERPCSKEDLLKKLKPIID